MRTHRNPRLSVMLSPNTTLVENRQPRTADLDGTIAKEIVAAG